MIQRHLERQGTDAGVALITTLLLLTLLGAATAPLAVLARLQTRIGAYETRRQQARSLAWSALQTFLVDLPQADAFAYPPAEDGSPVTTWVLTSDELLPKDRGGFQVQITDEAGKLPLCRVDASILATLPGMNSGLSAAILDWIDSDDDTRPDGAEVNEYAELKYRPRNGPLPTVAELGLVLGVTQELLWGEDTNANGELDRGEDANNDGIMQQGISEWVSPVHTLSPASSSLINLNTASAAQLVAASNNQLPQSQAQTIVNFRQANGPYQSLAQLTSVPGLPWQNLRTLIDRVRPVANAADDMARVNLNTAPEQVLQALPGVTPELIEAIVERRSSEPFSNLAQLWELDTFGPANAAMLDWVAVRGGPWRLLIKAWPAAGKPVVYAEAIVSRVGNTGRLLYWRML